MKNNLLPQICFLLILCFCFNAKSQGISCSQAAPVTPGTYLANTLIGEASQFDADSAGWYSFTPSVSGILNINSCGGGSDTRIHIWEGTCGSLQLIESNDDFTGCISSGSNAYASRIENVILIAGNTYFFEWDDVWSSSGFTWSFSFSVLPNNNDVEINYLTNRYTRIPISQAQNGIALGGTLKNLSSNSLTNVVLTAEIYELPNTTTPVTTFSSTPTSLNIGDELTVVSGIWSPVLTSSKSYQIKYVKTQTEVDQVTSNDQITQNLILDYNYLARDNDTYTTAFNWGSSNYSQGVRYSVTGSDQMTGVQYFIASNSTSQVYTVQVFPITNGTIGTTALYTSANITNNGAGWKTHIFPSPLAVNAGEYLIAITKTGSTAFPVGCDANVFTPERNFVRTGSSPWFPMELYTVSYAFMIRPRFGFDPANDIVFQSNLNPGFEYTRIHARQSLTGNQLQFVASGRNQGVQLIQGVTMTATLKDGQNNVLYSATSDPQDLNPSQTGTFSVPSFTVNELGDYTIEYVFSAPTDQIPQNNSQSTIFSRTKQSMSRTYGITGSLGIGANATVGVYDNGILGQTFTLSNDDYLDSVQFILNPTTPANQPVRVDIYATANGVPTGSPIASTTTYTTTSADNTNGVVLKLPIVNGSLPLTAGTYFFGVIENAGNLRLATSTNYHTPNRAFIKWDQSPAGANTWIPLEQFNLLVSYVINPIFKTCIPIANSDTITSASCGAQDGSINNSFIGGTGNLNFIWSNGETSEDLDSLASGVYALTVTDLNMCSVSSNFVVPSLSDLTVVSSKTNVTCPQGSDGQIALLISNGVSPYTFSWNNNIVANDTAIALSAGTYSCTVTDSTGCVVVVFDTLTELSAISITGNEDLTVCTSSETVDLSVSAQGGIGSYIYSWLGTSENQSTLSGVSLGNYTCVVSDSLGCTDTISTSVLLTDFSASASGTDLLCNGSSAGSVSINASGGTLPYTYDWSNSTNTTAILAGLSGGNYSCIVSDSQGCVDTVTAILTEPSAIVVTSNVTSEDVGNDGAIDLTVSGGVSPYTYQWENNSTSQDLVSLAGGTYTFTITDANGCVYLDSVVVPTSVGILENSNFKWSINPNPGEDFIQINSTLNGIILFFDVNGKLIMSHEVSFDKNTMDVSNLQPGVYLVQLNGQVKRWIKR